MKNMSRNKFLLCFKPVVVDMELMLEEDDDHSQNRATSSNMEIKNSNTAMVSKNSKSLRKRKTFSSLIKSVVFHFTQAKRNQSKFSFSELKSMNSQQKSTCSPHVEIQETKPESDISSFGSFCSCSSSSVSEPEKQSEDKEEEEEGKIINVFELFIVTLAIIIFWGKLCAILFTSVCFYLIPGKQEEGKMEFIQEKTEEKFTETEEFNKKRIVMEGLVKRKYQSRESMKVLT